MHKGKKIKQRSIHTTNRIYIQDSELLKTSFTPGTAYEYKVADNKISIVPSVKGKNKVARRKLKDKTKAVIDIRNKEALQTFDDTTTLKVIIYTNKIVVKCRARIKRFSHDEVKALIKDTLPRLTKKSKKVPQWAVRKLKSANPFKLDMISACVGAGLFDLGFAQTNGFNMKLALELEKDMCDTYRYNLGDHVVQADISTYDLNAIPEADVIVAGTPCQGFSNANRKDNFLDNPKNFLVRRFTEIVKKTKQCIYFVLENVPQILTAGKGQFYQEIKDTLEPLGFKITEGIYNAKDFGTAQNRKRAIIIGSKVGEVTLQAPEVDHYKTVGEALAGITEDLPNQKDISTQKAETLARMKCIKPGENYEALPEHLKSAQMLNPKKAKRPHSNVYYRLNPNAVAITITNPRKSSMISPYHDRMPSVRELARLFGVPDDFVFLGKLGSRQQMIANGVSVDLARSIAQAIKNHFTGAMLYYMQLA